MFLQARRDGHVCWSSSCNWRPVRNGGPQTKFREILFFRSRKKKEKKRKITVVCVYACHGAVSSPFNEFQSLLELIQYSHVSSWESWSCKGLLLCMPSIIYLFVVFYVD